jgi:CubicO group peptidase (beta-lactamase class C family)
MRGTIAARGYYSLMISGLMTILLAAGVVTTTLGEDATPTVKPVPKWALDFLHANNFTSGTIRIFDKFAQQLVPPRPTFASNVGDLSPRWGVPFPSDAFEPLYPIGSNTKLFVSVGLYQLVERGVISSIEDDVAEYLNASDFAAMGIENVTRYCPTLQTNSTSSCERISFAALLGMTSGIAIDPAGEFNIYRGSVAPSLRSFILKPLMFKPDTAFFYANSGFNLLTYLLEKLSGLTFEQYLTRHIFSKVHGGLPSTRYDPYHAQLGASERLADESTVFLDAANTSRVLGRGTCWSELDLGSINGAGGMTGSAADLATWYRALFQFAPNGSAVDTPLLRAASLMKVIAPRTSYTDGGPYAYYSQGVVTVWVSKELVAIWYQGGTICVNTAIVYSVTSSVLMTVFTATPTYYVNASVFHDVWPRQTQGVVFDVLGQYTAQPDDALSLAILLMQNFTTERNY